METPCRCSPLNTYDVIGWTRELLSKLPHPHVAKRWARPHAAATLFESLSPFWGTCASAWQNLGSLQDPSYKGVQALWVLEGVGMDIVWVNQSLESVTTLSQVICVTEWWQS